MLLAGEARVAELVQVPNIRYAMDHASACHLLQCSELLVPELLMPRPRVVTETGCEADRLHNL